MRALVSWTFMSPRNLGDMALLVLHVTPLGSPLFVLLTRFDFCFLSLVPDDRQLSFVECVRRVCICKLSE